MNINKNKGITLIALVVTIIILLILVAVSIAFLGGENGIITKAKKAKEQTEISSYKEKIELIKAEEKIGYEGEEVPVSRLQEVFSANEHKNWVARTEIINDNSKEKLKLVTKEGYIFYITDGATEYKGKGEVYDTSSLYKSDMIDLQAVEDTSNGKKIKITNLAESYYELVYQIDSTEGPWIKIKSGDTVELAYGKTLYAKLLFGSDYGEEHKITLAHTKPIITANDISVNDLRRKTSISLASLFNVTWGSEGTGTTKYKVSGNYKFNNINFESESLINLEELELGTYTITCTATAPGSQALIDDVSKDIEVEITKLANTTVQDENNNSENAYAIYSEYDLAHFRDLVNNSQPNINAKLMNDISLANVCSSSIGSWTPIGNYADNNSLYYKGIFSGNTNEISSIFINNSKEAQGLFGSVKDAFINKLTVTGDVSADTKVGGIIGQITGTSGCKISDCTADVNVTSNNLIGGIIGEVINDANNVTIENCENKSSITAINSDVGGIVGCVWNDYSNKNDNIQILNCRNSGTIKANNYTAGGIIGLAAWMNNSTVSNCTNIANVISTNDNVGGIIGNITRSDNFKVEECINQGEINCSNSSSAGGIVGATFSKSDSYNGTIKILKCSNTNTIKANNYSAGGISGSVGYTTLCEIKECTNSGTISTNTFDFAGGIVGGIMDHSTCNISNVSNTGSITAKRYDVGGILGAAIRYATVSIQFAANSGTIKTTSSNCAGGIAGGVSAEEGSASLTVTCSYNKGEVSVPTISNECAGGILGISWAGAAATISNCYNSGRVSAWSGCGGIVGVVNNNNASADVTYCHNVGTLSATKDLGGIIGGGVTNISESYNHWLAGCGATYGFGYTRQGASSTATEMKTQSHFTGWAFSMIWQMGTDYPVLRNVPSL